MGNIIAELVFELARNRDLLKIYVTSFKYVYVGAKVRENIEQAKSAIRANDIAAMKAALRELRLNG